MTATDLMAALQAAWPHLHVYSSAWWHVRVELPALGGYGLITFECHSLADPTWRAKVAGLDHRVVADVKAAVAALDARIREIQYDITPAKQRTPRRL